MELYTKINKLHEDDVVEMRQRIIDMQIAAEEKNRAKYESEIEKMKNELKDIEDRTQEIRDKTAILDEELKKYPPPSDQSYIYGDFFHRLNACEVFDAQVNGKIEGQKIISQDLLSLNKKQALANQKLEQKLQQISEQIPGGYVDAENLTQEERDMLMNDKGKKRIYKATLNKEALKLIKNVTQGRQEVQQLDDQFREIAEEAESTQMAIKQLTHQLKENPALQTDELIQQSNQLSQEIVNKKQQLQKIEEEYRKEQGLAQISSTYGVEPEKTDKKMRTDEKWMERQKTILQSKNSAESISSEESWAKEREALLLAIRNTKLEIKNTRKQESGSSDAASQISRRSSQSSSPKSKTNKEEKKPENVKSYLRKVFQMELDMINDNTHPVLQAIQNEKEYSKQLDKSFAEVERTTKTIEDFSKKLFGDKKEAADDSDYDNKKQRIAMLKAELEELRKQIGE